MKLTHKIFGAFSLIVAAGMLIAASINRNRPVPDSWAVETGTNAFLITADAAPGVRYRGSNWTGSSFTITGTNGVNYIFVRGLLVNTN